MEVKYRLLVASLFITLTLFTAIFLLGSFLNQERETVVNQAFSQINQDFSEMQTIFLLADSHDRELACLALKKKLIDMDESLWDLGFDLERYAAASEEIKESDYYEEQKIRFNENQILYYLILEDAIETCGFEKQIILYFYADRENCSKCDDQSFILRDITLEDEDRNLDREVAVFSLDTDLGVGSIDILNEYYELQDYPCVIINDNEPMCGIKGREEIMTVICNENSNLTLCADDWYRT